MLVCIHDVVSMSVRRVQTFSSCFTGPAWLAVKVIDRSSRRVCCFNFVSMENIHVMKSIFMRS